MIKLKLGEKNYQLPFITARALREIGGVEALYKRAADNEALGSDDMDTAIEWLCVLFNNAFTPDEVLDNYPVASFWVDVFTIFLSVSRQVELVLGDFPTRPEATIAGLK